MTSRHLQQVACAQVFPAKRPKLTAVVVAWNTREGFRAPPSLPAPHFPNCCYSCFWPDLSQWRPRCGGGRLGFHSPSERPEGGQLRLFADLFHLWPVGRVRREAARVQHGSVSPEGPSDCTNAVWGGGFFLGPQPRLKKEVNEKENIEVQIAAVQRCQRIRVTNMRTQRPLFRQSG